MTTPKLRPWLTLLLVFVVHGARGGPAKPELFLDPWEEPALVEWVGGHPEALGLFSRVHLLVFANGETLQATTGLPFGKYRKADGAALLERVSEACRREGVPLHYAADLLLWGRPGQSPSQVVVEHPELLEFSAEGSCDSGYDPGKYASPFRDDVVEVLGELLRQLVGTPSELAGLTLRFRISPFLYLGYSQAARGALIRAQSLDPVDLGEGREALWAQWRLGALTERFGRLVAPFRTPPRTLDIVAWASGGQYARDIVLRGRSADDWLAWLEQDLVDQLVLDEAWDQAWSRMVVPGYLKLAGRLAARAEADTPLSQVVARSWIMLRLAAFTQEELATRMAGLEREGWDVQRLVYYPTTAAGLDRVVKLIGGAGGAASDEQAAAPAPVPGQGGD